MKNSLFTGEVCFGFVNSRTKIQKPVSSKFQFHNTKTQHKNHEPCWKALLRKKENLNVYIPLVVPYKKSIVVHVIKKASQGVKCILLFGQSSVRYLKLHLKKHSKDTAIDVIQLKTSI